MTSFGLCEVCLIDNPPAPKAEVCLIDNPPALKAEVCLIDNPPAPKAEVCLIDNPLSLKKGSATVYLLSLLSARCEASQKRRPLHIG